MVQRAKTLKIIVDRETNQTFASSRHLIRQLAVNVTSPCLVFPFIPFNLKTLKPLKTFLFTVAT